VNGSLTNPVFPSWFWKYCFDGKKKGLSLACDPEVSLEDARPARDDAQKQHPSG
jgi:hypothetical protein